MARGQRSYDRSDRYDRGYGSSRDYNDQITSAQLYIMNLPYSVSWQDLKDLFRNAGNVLRADVNMDFDGRSKGTGIVLFDSIRDAQYAIKQFQGYDWQGRQLEIREDRFAGSRGRGRGRGGFDGGRGESRYDNEASRDVPPAEPNPFTDNAWGNGEPSETIFVKNLPWSTSNDDLIELFTTVGTVEQAEICFEPSGRSRGVGVVRMESSDSASTAIQKFQGYLYGGRPLGLSFVRYENEDREGDIQMQ